MEIVSDTIERIQVVQFNGSRAERLEVTATMEAEGWREHRSRLTDIGVCVEFRKLMNG